MFGRDWNQPSTAFSLIFSICFCSRIRECWMLCYRTWQRTLVILTQGHTFTAGKLKQLWNWPERFVRKYGAFLIVHIDKFYLCSVIHVHTIYLRLLTCDKCKTAPYSSFLLCFTMPKDINLMDSKGFTLVPLHSNLIWCFSPFCHSK